MFDLHTLKAQEASVARFSTIFFWPLTIDLPGCEDRDAAGLCDIGMQAIVEEQVKSLCQTNWKSVDDGLSHLPELNGDKAREAAYAEYTYFHDYIQRHYFSSTEARPFKLLQRTNIHTVKVTLADPWKIDRGEPAKLIVTLRVDRLNLYVFGAGLAVLVVEVSGDGEKWTSGPATMADVMRFNDRMRRAHAPFVDANKNAHLDHVPQSVSWMGSGEDISATANFSTMVSGLIGAVGDAREVKPFEHWTRLLKGWDIAPAQSSGISWRHVCDERLPLMSTITLADSRTYRALREGDWMRLCFVDSAGSDPYPYQRDFMQQAFADHVYDRYHHKNRRDSTDSPVRYLFTSYSMIAVGVHDDFFNNHIATHMRRHYFQMMLFVQVEYALLLAFSSRISLAVADLDRMRAPGWQAQPPCHRLVPYVMWRLEQAGMTAQDRADAQFQKAMQWIERDFMQFVHRHRLTGVSSQLQAQEMYQKIRQHKGVDALFGDLERELSLAMNYLYRQAERAQAEAAERLNHIASFGVIVGLALTLLALPPLTDNPVLSAFGIVGDKGSRWNVGVLGVAVGGFATVGYWLTARHRRSSGLLKALLGGIAVLGVTLGGGLLWSDREAPHRAALAQPALPPLPAPSK